MKEQVTIRPTIYEFQHHAAYLRKMFDYKKKEKKVFSYAFAANRLKISVSYLKNVVARKHALSLELVLALGTLLDLSKAEVRYLALLITRDQIKDVSMRSYFDHILSSLTAHAENGKDPETFSFGEKHE